MHKAICFGIALLLLALAIPTPVQAGSPDPILRLEPASLSKEYRSSLRERIDMTGFDASTKFRFAAVGGQLPPGLTLTESGEIRGQIANWQREYRFSVRVDVPGDDTVDPTEITVLLPVRRGIQFLESTTATAAAAPGTNGSNGTNGESTLAASSNPIAPAAGKAAAEHEGGDESTEDYFHFSGVVMKRDAHGKTSPAPMAKVWMEKDGTPAKIRETDENGRFRFDYLDEGNYTIRAADNEMHSVKEIGIPVGEGHPSTFDPVLVQRRPPGTLFRAITGYEQSGASSTESAQNFFFNFFISRPITTSKQLEPLGSRFRWWGDIRITTVPQNYETPVREFVSEFTTELGKVPVNKLAQATEFLTGFEVRVFPFKSPDKENLHNGWDGSDERYQLSLIGSFGALTPITPRESAQVFKVNQAIRDLYPTLAFLVPDNGTPDNQNDDGTAYVAFVQPERDRFFHQYYFGVRLRTDYFERGETSRRVPGQLDLTWGKNSAVTGGSSKNGSVFRIDGFYPMPLEPLDFIYLYGTAFIGLAETKVTPPIFADRVTTEAEINAILNGAKDNASITHITVNPLNRDFYRIGVGIDFVSLFSKWRTVGQ